MFAYLTEFNPALILAIATFFSIVVFVAVWFLLNRFYARVDTRWAWLSGLVRKTRQKGQNPLIQKYGLFGLAFLMALPFPTIGVYGATLLTWLLGMKLRSSLIAVVTGATISNGILIVSIFGFLQIFLVN